VGYLEQAARQEQPVALEQLEQLERPARLGLLAQPGPQLLPARALERVQVRQRAPGQAHQQVLEQALRQVLPLGQVPQRARQQALLLGRGPALIPELAPAPVLVLVLERVQGLERFFLHYLLHPQLFLDHLLQQRLHLGQFRLQLYCHCSEFLENKSVLKAL
jgi:hypothetical protein